MKINKYCSKIQSQQTLPPPPPPSYLPQWGKSNYSHHHNNANYLNYAVSALEHLKRIRLQSKGN